MTCERYVSLGLCDDEECAILITYDAGAWQWHGNLKIKSFANNIPSSVCCIPKNRNHYCIGCSMLVQPTGTTDRNITVRRRAAQPYPHVCVMTCELAGTIYYRITHI